MVPRTERQDDSYTTETRGNEMPMVDGKPYFGQGHYQAPVQGDDFDDDIPF